MGLGIGDNGRKHACKRHDLYWKIEVSVCFHFTMFGTVFVAYNLYSIRDWVCKTAT